MRRLPKIMFATGATIIVVVALLVSTLRMMLPLINEYRPQIVAKVQSVSGIPLDVGFMQGTWETFGPALELRDIRAQMPKADLQIQRVTLALDVWQSLLHWRWQFRDLTFYQLQLDLHTTLDVKQNNGSNLETSNFYNIFLRQLDRFDLRNSRISFLTPSGPRAELEIPQLTWLNSSTRHRAEGQISLSTINGQHGVVQVRMDLHDNQGILNNGTVYMQADNIDLKPWISRWLQNNTGLDNAEFSLAAWLSIKSGEIYRGNVLLSQGQANWTVGSNSHQLSVDNFVLEGRRQGNGWQIDAPVLNLKTDGQAWPEGRLSALWLPENTQFLGPEQRQELRIRASNLQLERIGPLLPTLSPFTPELLARWVDLQPQGYVDALALDIPISQLETTRFQAKWHDVSWQYWGQLPGVNNLDGELSGSARLGRLNINLKNSLLPYGDMFRAPLEVSQASGALNWRIDDKGWALWSDQLDVQAKSLWGNGSFYYMQPNKDPSQLNQAQPWLNILAGIRLYNAADAWRYFPVSLMGEKLADYLTEALQGGQVENATLVYNGNPHDFPYKNKEGQFQVYVPLRNAVFQFQPDWPALDNLAIDLNFLNEGLWMNAPHTLLGKVTGSNISAIIPDYLKEKLYVDADVLGEGRDVHDYFTATPLKDSVAETLDELQVGGKVSGRLHLDIPLEEESITHASGEVTLNNNSLLVKPLQSQLENINGKFRFYDGNLESDTLSANWYGQPLTVNFTTKEQPKDFLVNVGLQGDWLPAKLPGVPDSLAKRLSGSANWQGKVAVKLPQHGKPDYQVDVSADLKKVSSHLPSPLDKTSGQVLPLHVQVIGGLEAFTLSGSAGNNNAFNSQWLLQDEKVELARAIWQTDSKKIPSLPDDKALVFKLPAIDGERWLALLAPELTMAASPFATSSTQPKIKGSKTNVILPNRLTLQTPELLVGGQAWNQLTLQADPLPSGMKITAKGQEVDGSLLMADYGPWHADLNYLYYNPQWGSSEANNPLAQAVSQKPQPPSGISFSDWPVLQLRCKACWILGQNIGRVNADLTPKGSSLVLTNGLIEAGNGRANITGQWQQDSAGDKTILNIGLNGPRIDETLSFFGLTTLIKNASFAINADINWRGVPWEPQMNTLSGTLKGRLGRGQLTDLGGGRAGQLLRLVSFDALLRKLQLDFSDTFSRDFAFDSILSTATLKNGVMSTHDLVIDGLAADIAMNGNVDLVKRTIAMEAVITPELSATVGVATAFAINPIVGAAVFAASKILGPLWSKVSLIRYQISGNLDQPTIHEVLRQLKENEAP